MFTIKNLKEADDNNYDLLIIGRGGGASEDLSAFDDEELVRCIYDLKTPIISAVGHEINQTLCDLVADKYASTPTGAAEIAVPDVDDILYDVNQQKNYLDSLINGKVTQLENKLLNLKNRKYFLNIDSIYDNYFEKLNNLSKMLNLKINNYIINLESKLSYEKRSLTILNPENILSKGYSIVKNEKGEVVNSITKVNSGDKIVIKFSDGHVNSVVTSKENNNG